KSIIWAHAGSDGKSGAAKISAKVAATGMNGRNFMAHCISKEIAGIIAYNHDPPAFVPAVIPKPPRWCDFTVALIYARAPKQDRSHHETGAITCADAVFSLHSPQSFPAAGQRWPIPSTRSVKLTACRPSIGAEHFRPWRRAMQGAWP